MVGPGAATVAEATTVPFDVAAQVSVLNLKSPAVPDDAPAGNVIL